MEIILCCYRLEGFKKKDEQALSDGLQFLMKICQEALLAAEHRDRKIAEYVKCIDHEFDQFQQWSNSLFQK